MNQNSNTSIEDLLVIIERLITERDCKRLSILHEYGSVLSKSDWYYSLDIENLPKDILPVFSETYFPEKLCLYKYDDTVIKPLSDYVRVRRVQELQTDFNEDVNRAYEDLTHAIEELDSIELTQQNIYQIDLTKRLYENYKNMTEIYKFKHICIDALESAEKEHMIKMIQKM